MEPILLNINPTYLNLNAINVMEILVLKEVDRQLEKLSQNLTQYIKRVEVATYALNRLPSLYASSQEGLKYQYKQAKKEYKSQIRIAVRQGIAAVQRDPLRRSTPLFCKKKPKSKITQKSFKPQPNTPQAKEIAHQAAQKLRDTHSKNKHAEYCQMALELAEIQLKSYKLQGLIVLTILFMILENGLTLLFFQGISNYEFQKAS